MFEWLKRKRETPLRGAPAVRRQKSYSSQSGYVYQYFYEGFREVAPGGERGIEYGFNVSADRKTSFPVRVFLPDASTAGWESEHERLLQSNERYAIAKVALFQAFDERDRPESMKKPVLLRPADVAGILETLGIG